MLEKFKNILVKYKILRLFPTFIELPLSGLIFACFLFIIWDKKPIIIQRKIESWLSDPAITLDISLMFLFSYACISLCEPIIRNLSRCKKVVKYHGIFKNIVAYIKKILILGFYTASVNISMIIFFNWFSGKYIYSEGMQPISVVALVFSLQMIFFIYVIQNSIIGVIIFKLLIKRGKREGQNIVRRRARQAVQIILLIFLAFAFSYGLKCISSWLF